MIGIKPHNIIDLGYGFSLSSSHLALIFLSIVIIILALYIRKTAALVPTSLQVVAEGIYEWFYEKVKIAFDNEVAVKRVFPLITSFFIVIIFSNLFGLLPILHAVILEGEGVNLFKAPTSHLGMTLAFTLITLTITHVSALSIHPLKYIGNFIQIAPFFKIRSLGDFAKALLDLFLGILDLIGEIAKVVSLSCRLFGNVLAGELMALVIMSLSVYTQFFVPIPFIFLGLLSGVIQALVFALLSLNYISLAVKSVK